MNTHDGAFFAGVTTDDNWYDRHCVDVPNSRQVVVFVERIRNTAALDGSKEIWLKIRMPAGLKGPTGSRETLRVADENDKRVLGAKYPSFFLDRFSGPEAVPCVAEWLDGD